MCTCRHNVRFRCGAKFFSGDSVYYKRNDNKRWRGPGKALGQDGQQILIKHDSIYVRCHPCHVILKRDHTGDEENISESEHPENIPETLPSSMSQLSALELLILEVQLIQLLNESYCEI